MEQLKLKTACIRLIGVGLTMFGNLGSIQAAPVVFWHSDPVKPGETRMDVSYTVPSTTKFSGKVVASDAATHLVTPGTVRVAAPRPFGLPGTAGRRT